MNHRRLAGVSAVAALVALAPTAAHAHVTLQPDEVPAGGFARLNVRVPNERDNAGTAKVAVQFPDGFAAVSYEPVPGWKVRVVKEKTDKPIELHGEPVNEQIDQVVFTASKGEEIQPGEFRDFGLSLGLPEGAADADVQGAADLRGGRGRPLDRRTRVRRAGAAGQTDRGSGGARRGRRAG